MLDELGTNNFQVMLENLSNNGIPTMCNNASIGGSIVLKHADVFSIADRMFRFEGMEPLKETPLRERSQNLVRICLLIFPNFLGLLGIR